VAIVEGVVLEHHDVRNEEGLLQVRMVYISSLDAAQGQEAPPELGIEVRRVDGGRDEAAGDGGGVKLASEDAAIESRVAG
jgi:hypothetical protein